MTIREAITILTEYNKWRRGLPPYDGETPETHRECPYSPTEIGEAIDTLVEWVKILLDGKAMIVDKGWLEQHDAIRTEKACEFFCTKCSAAEMCFNKDHNCTIIRKIKAYLNNE